jgi:hypothetical protein
MTPAEELFIIAQWLENVRASPQLAAAEEGLSSLNEAANEAGRAFSGSWLGYHACVYYEDLAPAPPGAQFSQEWGLQDLSFTSLGSRGKWRQCDPEEVKSHLRASAGSPDLGAVEIATLVS